MSLWHVNSFRERPESVAIAGKPALYRLAVQGDSRPIDP